MVMETFDALWCLAPDLLEHCAPAFVWLVSHWFTCERLFDGLLDLPGFRFFRAYWGFADHFKEQADSLLNSLDSQHKKLLAGEMSKSSSNNSLTGPSKSTFCVDSVARAF